MSRLQRYEWLSVLVVFVGSLAMAITNDDVPATIAERAYEIKANTLCPVCDGQNVLESNAPVAAAIRRQVDELIEEDRSDEEIHAYLARQYGQDVNAKPPGTGISSLVWIIPVLVAVLAVGVLSSSFKKWRSGRGKLVTDEDRELVRKLRDEP